MTFNDNEQMLVEQLEAQLKLIDDPKMRIQAANHLLKLSNELMTQHVREQRHIAYVKRKEAENQLRPKLRLITKLSLGSGDLIRLKGTRDHGIREVINLSGWKIECYQLRFRSSLNWHTDSCNLESYRRTGIKTKHDLSNVTHVSEKGQWRSLLSDWLDHE